MLRTFNGARLSSPRLLWVLLAVYVAYHAFTWPYSPLPWQDDSVLASVGVDVMEHGTFLVQVDSRMGEDLGGKLYGPIYFWTVAAVFKGLGFGLSQYRMVGTVMGLLTLLIVWRLFAHAGVGRAHAVLVMAALTLDPLLNASMHHGRMDPMAACFALASTWLYLSRAADGWGRLAASAAFAGLAILTTPRIGALLLPVAIALVARCLTERTTASLLAIAVWSGIILAMYLPWVFFMFGGPLEMIAYYARMRGPLGATARLVIPTEHSPLAVLTVLAVGVIAIAVLRRRERPGEPFYVALGAVAIFTAVVGGGPYTQLVVPWAYLLLALAAVRARWMAGLVVLLLCFNGAIFAVKAVTILTSLEQRDPAGITAFVARHIPRGSRVVGDGQYYFAVRSAGSRLELIDEWGYDLAEIERYRRIVYDYDYVLLSSSSKWRDTVRKPTRHVLSLYAAHATLEPIASYETPPSFLTSLLSGIDPARLRESGYNARLYRRLR